MSLKLNRSKAEVGKKSYRVLASCFSNGHQVGLLLKKTGFGPKLSMGRGSQSKETCACWYKRFCLVSTSATTMQPLNVNGFDYCDSAVKIVL